MFCLLFGQYQVNRVFAYSWQRLKQVKFDKRKNKLDCFSKFKLNLFRRNVLVRNLMNIFLCTL